ncbi:hypothetical protein [Amycolatopsis sp. MtRt-6]|uniref:hypothetical protein n=1 Tax=Amycolatopsis sp. MtRt-6 TaxID=2792782 RepID=UPI001A8D3B3F|nr:hypothetical protein [Amycolatopsis sp. MtRt-6]
MASPDTDELATVPLPAGNPAARPRPDEPGTVRRRRGQGERPEAPDAGVGAAEAPTVEQRRIEPERIEPADAGPETEPAAAPVRGRWWRGLTGSLAAGLAVLALGVLLVGAIGLYTGMPGPGATLLIGHPVAAALALLAQRVADRRDGPSAVGAGIAVVLFTVSAVSLFWLT